MTKKTVAFHCLGCKVNHYETNALKALFQTQGYDLVPFSQYADVYVINTCAVTQQATSKSRQMMRQARRRNPKAKIVMVGCYVQITEKDKAEDVFPEADLLIGSSEKTRIVSEVEALLKSSSQSGLQNFAQDYDSIRQYEHLEGAIEGDRVRAEIKVQDGCEQFCAYCIIPYARGPERSRALPDIITEITKLVASGFKEIILTGIHLGHYGRDLSSETDLAGLVQQVLDHTTVARLRLSSIEPNDITEKLLKHLSSQRMAHHLHIPLQSGCDKTLSAMSRQYSTQNYRRLITEIREIVPDIAITTDLIVGFPGESEADFTKTCSFVKEMNFARMHVFRYSARPGTPAATFSNQIPKSVRLERSHIMHQIAAQLQADFQAKMVGQSYKVLFEREIATGIWEGHAGNYALVRVKSQENLKNCFVNVKIDHSNVNYVFGNVI